jgi:hypothetical protein
MQQQEEWARKDNYTYDHEGNMMEVKQVKVDYLPSISSMSTRARVTEGVGHAKDQKAKKLQQLSLNRAKNNPPTELLQKEFN